MEQEATSIFEATKIIKIPSDIAQTWKAAGAYLWENNGWDFLGNAYLTSIYYPDMLEQETQKLGIDWRDYAEYHEGYSTYCFGFHLGDKASDCDGLDDEALEVCAKIMQELGIEWCGWADPPGFELLATKEQISELERRLQEPISEWKRSELVLQIINLVTIELSFKLKNINFLV